MNEPVGATSDGEALVVDRVRSGIDPLVGAAVLAWLALFVAPVTSTAGMPLIERLVLLGPLVVVPLGLHAWGRWRRWVLAGAAAAALSALVPAGAVAMALGGVWALTTGVLALNVVRTRVGSWHELTLPELLGDLGVLYLPVGAAWWVLSRRGGSFLQFDASIVALTAAHFHFAGFAASSIAGLVGRRLVLEPATARWRALYRPSAWVVGLGPPLVAVGITFSPLVEVLSAITLALGVLGLALVMIGVVARRAWADGYRGASVAVGCSALCLFATMTLAVVYATGEFALAPALPIPTMVRVHGLLNALGFATVGLLGLSALGSVGDAGARRQRVVDEERRR